MENFNPKPKQEIVRGHSASLREVFIVYGYTAIPQSIYTLNSVIAIRDY